MTTAVTITPPIQNNQQTQSNQQNTSPQNSTKAAQPKPQNKQPKPETSLLYREFFENKAASNSKSLAQRLAACVLKMSPNQTTEAKEEFLTALKDTITNYDGMADNLEELSMEISKLRDENLQITQKSNDQIPMNFQIPNFLEHFFDKEFFPNRADSPIDKIQILAFCLLEKPFTIDTQNNFLKALKNTILSYESMAGELKDLSNEIEELKKEKLNTYENPIIEYTPQYEEVYSPKKLRKQLLNSLKDLVEETANFYNTLDTKLKGLLEEKKDFSASMCLDKQTNWDEQKEALSFKKSQLNQQEGMIQEHLLSMKKEVEEIEVKLANKVPAAENQLSSSVKKEIEEISMKLPKKVPAAERQKIQIPTIASLSLTYLETKRLKDSLTFYYYLALHQMKALEWKLIYIHLADTAFAEITQLAIDIGHFRAEVDGLKSQLQRQAVGVENTLKSTIVPKYNDLADRTKKSFSQIKMLNQSTENKVNKEQKETLFIYDSQTKLILSQEVEKIQAVIQLEQQEAYDKIKTVWETIEAAMGPDTKIPSLANRWLLHSVKPLEWDINKLNTAAKEKYTSLPLDSTEGRLWTLQKIVHSPLQ